MPKNNKKSTSVVSFLIKNWSIFLNAILTILIGVGVAIYLQKDQQSFEISKQESNQEAQFANIKIEVANQCPQNTYYYCAESLIVSNESNTIAKNIKIAISLTSVGKFWVNEILDVSSFDVSATNPATSFVAINKVDTSQNSIGNKIKIVEIKTLPAKSNVVFMLRSLKLSELENPVINKTKTILFVVPREMQIPTDEFNDYLKKNYFIAGFSVFFSCENCKAENQPQAQLTLPIVETWEGDVLEIMKFETSEDIPRELITKVKISYVATENINDIIFPNCLKWVKSPNGEIRLTPYVTTPEDLRQGMPFLFDSIDCESTWNINE